MFTRREGWNRGGKVFCLSLSRRGFAAAGRTMVCSVIGQQRGELVRQLQLRFPFIRGRARFPDAAKMLLRDFKMDLGCDVVQFQLKIECN